LYIYEITNNINGKKYIGQTLRPVESRFARHINDAINNHLDTHFARAIRKYGADNFSVKIIDTAETQEELTSKERHWIKLYDTVNSGYNETDAEYKCGGNTYRNKSESEMKEIGERIRNTKIGSQNPQATPVKCFNTTTKEELFFNSASECKEYFGENTHRFITGRVTGKTKSLYRNCWKIAYKNEEYCVFTDTKKKPWLKTEVTNTVTGESATFPSMAQALKWCCLKKADVEKYVSRHIKTFSFGIYNFQILN